MKPEQKARQKIERQLNQCGWLVQDYQDLDLSAATGIAVRKFPLSTGHCDYLLCVNRRAVGVVEAKPEGHALTGAETQSADELSRPSCKRGAGVLLKYLTASRTSPGGSVSMQKRRAKS